MKRIIAMLLALLMVVSVGTSALADDNVQFIGNGNTVVFIDVPQDHWAKEQIGYFAEQGIINGYEDGTFKPSAGVTREEFCKILVSTFKAALETPTTPTFSDVPASRWSFPYVEVCRDFLTTYGNPFGGLPAFHPTEYATREDIAVALVKMMGFTADDADYPEYAKRKFSDGSEISPNLLPYVSLACEKELISGYPDGTFGPAKGITRAETVVLLNRATKQAFADVNAELVVNTGVIYSQDGKTATINITAEKGTTVTVNGEKVHMSDNSYDEYEGNYIYTFEQEGSKDFVVEAKKGAKTRTLNVTAKYGVKAPQLVITGCPTTSEKETVSISGSVTDERDNKPVVTVNGESVWVDYSGNWTTTVSLTEGSNTITIVATNKLGKSTTETRTVEFGVGAPKLVITNCPASSNKASVTISGSVSDTNDNKPVVTVNGEAVWVDYSGNWTTTVSLTEGSNTITIVATNKLGKSTTETRTVTYTSGTVQQPTIPVQPTQPTVPEQPSTPMQPAYPETPVQPSLPTGSDGYTGTTSYGPEIKTTNWPYICNTATVTVSGIITDRDSNGPFTLTINGVSVPVSSSGTWTHTVTLAAGENRFLMIAKDGDGISGEVDTFIILE